MSDVLDWAKYYVNERHWSVIPLKYGGKEPAIISSWRTYCERLPTNTELDYWFGGSSNYNIGVVTGEISNLIVIDIDDSDTARQILKHLSNYDRRYMYTPIVQTSSGVHIYYQPFNNRIRTHSFELNGRVHHVKAYNSYVVAPPSVHESGVIYSMITEDPEFFIPAVVDEVELMQQFVYVGAKPTSKGNHEKPINWASELCDMIPKGSRNDAAAQLCGLLINKFPHDPGFIHGMMVAWNNTYCDPPLPDSELNYLVESEYRRYGPKE